MVIPAGANAVAARSTAAFAEPARRLPQIVRTRIACAAWFMSEEDSISPIPIRVWLGIVNHNQGSAESRGQLVGPSVSRDLPIPGWLRTQVLEFILWHYAGDLKAAARIMTAARAAPIARRRTERRLLETTVGMASSGGPHHIPQCARSEWLRATRESSDWLHLPS